MARPGVTESEVFAAIQSLIEMGTKVTVEGVRAELSHGSPNTINRHLRTWREKPQQPVLRDSSIQVRQLKKRQVELEAQVQRSLEQTEQLSLEVLERDRKVVRLEKELEGEKQALKEARQEIEHLKSLHEAIAQERQQMLGALVAAQEIEAQKFREDVKALNQMSLNSVREISMSGQNAWLEEKVKVRDLMKEVEQLRASQQSLEQQILAEQQKHQPLRKQISDQEQIIKHCLDPKKFESYKHGSREAL